MELAYNGWIYKLVITNFDFAVDAQISGPPEFCHPAEDDHIEFEIVSITPGGGGYSMDDLLHEEEMEGVLIDKMYEERE